MKTKTLLQIRIIACFLLFVPLLVQAQEDNRKSNIFIRVYDLQGKKINQGRIISDNGTVLYLGKGDKTVSIPIDQIGLVKTKHSAGNNIVLGAAIGATAVGAIGIATADPDAWIFGYTAGEGAAIGAVIGGIAGASLGASTILFKNAKTYIIDGDNLKWKEFKENIIGFSP